MQPPPTLKNTEKNRSGTEPPKKKKVCWREEEETATGQKRPPEKKREPPKNEKAGRWEGRAVMGREKSAKKAGGNPFPNCQKEQKRPFRGLVGAGKFYYLYAVLPKPFRYGPNIRYIPDRHGAAGLGGLRCPAFFRSRIRLSFQPQIRAARAQQDRLGADGVARIRGDVRAVAALRKDVGSRAADALRALSGPLPATGVHLSAAHARRVENAARHRPDGHVLQHAQRPDSRNLIFISAGRCSSREWP